MRRYQPAQRHTSHSSKPTSGLASLKASSRGKNTMGWCYGFKLHLIVNDRGALPAGRLTPGNMDDRRPLPDLTRSLSGKLYGDKG